MWRSQVVMVSDGRVLAAEPAGRTRPRLRLRFAAAGIAYRTLEAVQEHKATQGGVRGRVSGAVQGSMVARPTSHSHGRSKLMLRGWYRYG